MASISAARSHKTSPGAFESDDEILYFFMFESEHLRTFPSTNYHLPPTVPFC
jgi:hypothetical protein